MTIRIFSLILIFHIIQVGESHSQTLNADNALRLVQLSNINTARSAGVAGSFGSLGADIHVANTNPAGIAEFRKSEIVVGGNLVSSNYTSTFGNSTRAADDSKFQLGTAGAVFHSKPNNFDTKTMNIAIGINQIASLEDDFYFEGISPGTIVDRWLNEASFQGGVGDLDLFETGPAYDAFAIDADSASGEFFNPDFVTFEERLLRSESIERSGYINEVFLSMGSNYKNKISWGATLGIPFFNFEENRIYSEVDQMDEVSFFDELRYERRFDLSGTGVNLKAGLIYKFTPQVRIGLAVHSPTVYVIKDDYETFISYTFTDGGTNTFNGDSGPVETFEYQITTPWRFLLGASYLYKLGDLKGFVSGDIEYLDYASTSYSPPENVDVGSNNAFADASDEIEAQGNATINYRVGTELAYKHFRVRLGAAINQSPFKESTRLDPGPGYNLGIGYRGQSFYIDAAFTARPTTRNYKPYEIAEFTQDGLPIPQQMARIETNPRIYSLTLGIKI